MDIIFLKYLILKSISLVESFKSLTPLSLTLYETNANAHRHLDISVDPVTKSLGPFLFPGGCWFFEPQMSKIL